MRISRREFLKAAAAMAAAGRLSAESFANLNNVLRGEGHPRVIWLQGAGCDGCAISILNSIHYTTVDDLLVNTIDLEFQSNLQAVAGDLAISAAEAASAVPGYVLIVEGSIPTGASGAYCRLWPGMTMYDALLSFATNASIIVALGACASFGGVSSGTPNPTEAKGVGEILVGDSRLMNIPGCPAHPDWLIGSLVYILTNGVLPPLDADRRPLQYFGKQIHPNCHNRREYCGEGVFADQLSDEGCMELLGCKGKKTYSDCFMRKWNSGGAGEYGVNWCIGAKSPCLGCVQPTFPDGMSPFYVYAPTPITDGENTENRVEQSKGRAADRRGE
ncbi:MAG: hydrogenase small subunit [Phycisphaerales bacterium]|nr:MAG: hydrogenase small subunit [Phycisphaerales bacterium]